MRTQTVVRLLVLLPVVFAFAFVSASASAATDGVSAFFGASGSGDGQFYLYSPAGLAVNAQSGDFYVVDTPNNRVERLGSDGTYLSQFGSQGDQDGQFSSPVGVAIDPVDGSVYVVDTYNSRIEKFSATGTYLAQFGSPGDQDGQLSNPAGIAVDPVSRDVLVVDNGNSRIVRFSRTGAFVSQFGTAGSDPGQLNNPTRVAVGPTGSVYVLEPYVGVLQFDATGALVQAVAPDVLVGGVQDLAVDPAGHIDVVQSAPDYSELRVFELDASGALVATHAVGAGITSVSGLAVNPVSGQISLAGSADESHVFVLGPVTSPTATIDPAGAVGVHQATFSGQVNPTGFPTRFHFEYRLPGDDWSSTPDESAGDGTGDISVTDTVTGLLAHHDYEVRLVAVKRYNPNAPATTATQTFTTDAADPVVTAPATGYIPRDATAFTVTADIDPNYLPTTYHFEYGPTTAYGTALPTPDAAVPGGTRTQVSQRLTGLAPGTVYHVRIVATNAHGTSVSDDTTVASLAGPQADGRGFEPSPADSRPYDVQTPQQPDLGFVAQDARLTAADGSVVAAGLDVNGTLPGMAVDGDAPDPIVFTRGSAAWQYHVPLGAISNCSAYFTPRIETLAPDLASYLISNNCPRLGAEIGPHDASGAPLDQGTLESLYRVDASDRAEYLSGAYGADGTGVVRTDPPNGTGGFTPVYNQFLGGSRDLSTIYFATPQALVPGAVDAPGVSKDGNIYRRTNGVTTLITRTADPGRPGYIWANPTDGVAPKSVDRPGAVSGDGDAITFTAPAAGRMVSEDTDDAYDVYQVRDGDVIWASQPENPTPQPAEDRYFEGASTDGHRIFLSSTERLTGDDTDTASDIYVYDEGQPAGSRLTRVSQVDPRCATITPDPCDDNTSVTDGDDVATQSSVAKFSTVSADGSHVFFVTGDILNPTDADGQQSLYVRDIDAGTTTYIAPAGAGASTADDGADASTTSGSLVTVGNHYFTDRLISVSADGRTAAFLLATDVALPADRGGENTDGARDLYVWRQGDGLRRVPPGTSTGANTTNEPSIGCRKSGVVDLANLRPCQAITPDGRTVFFQTVDALVAADTNNTTDVYTYDTVTHKSTLISGGDAPVDSTYYDSSASGDDIFFRTQETLDPSRDKDLGHFDLYDSRAGGVFPPAPGPPAPCDPLTDACAPPAGPGAPSAAVGSSAVNGPGNPAAPPPVTPGKLRVSIASPRKGSSFTLRVSAPAAGRIRVAGTRLKTVTRAVRPGTLYTLKVTLTRKGAARLKKQRRLRVAPRITFTPARGAATSTSVSTTLKAR